MLLVHKLKSYGIGGSLLDWFTNYLSNRTHCTVADGHSSRSCHVLSGVQQGSMLGPLLFLIFVNDRPSVTVDDASIFFTLTTPSVLRPFVMIVVLTFSNTI